MYVHYAAGITTSGTASALLVARCEHHHSLEGGTATPQKRSAAVASSSSSPAAGGDSHSISAGVSPASHHHSPHARSRHRHESSTSDGPTDDPAIIAATKYCQQYGDDAEPLSIDYFDSAALMPISAPERTSTMSYCKRLFVENQPSVGAAGRLGTASERRRATSKHSRN